MSFNSIRYRLGFDIGGTFTDFVLIDEERQHLITHKCLTTPDDPSVGALKGIAEILEKAGVALSQVDQLVHGTTLATNALIERRGCKLGLLTTTGFRDTLQLGTEQRYDIHDLFLRTPAPLVARRLRREVNERMSRDGTVIEALDTDQARREIAFLLDQKVEAIAVCLLHAYRNPAHERALLDLIRAESPDITVSLSSDVHPQVREYERVSTTTANAYVQPLMGRYVTRLEGALRERGYRGRLRLMQSSGDLSDVDTAANLPVRFLESGPAGGAQATAFIGRQIGHSDILSFDMGGTTAKSCLIRNGRADIAPMLEAARVHRFKRGSGLPIHAPVVDMIEIGAGGGSIAWVDELGLLKVGPESAGADPGPACYGLGGSDPTVTDANLLLGYLDPGFFLGGRMSLDKQAAENAISGLAKELNLSPMETAAGIADLVAENMASSARVHIVEKGLDPRNHAMMALGGAGPVHAARIAAKLGISEIIVPPASGAASALGILSAPIGYEVTNSMPGRLDALDLSAIDTLLASMEQECRSQLSSDDVEGSAVHVERFVELRLAGQMHQITIPLIDGPLATGDMEEIRKRFSEEYARLYTHVYEGAKIEAINWRVRCRGPEPLVTTHLAGGGDARSARKGSRPIYSPDEGALVDADVFDRYRLKPSDQITGPAVIEERESTTIVPAGATVQVDDKLNLRLKLGSAADSKVLVSSAMALEEAVDRINGDPIGLEIMWSRLINVAEECWHTVIRTAFSLIIGEAQDFACEILDAKGRQIVHSPRAMPVFNLTLPLVVNAMLERYPAQLLEDGDVLITNDPWLCAGHLFDIAIAVPVFREGRVVAFVGVVGHVSDIGGIKDDLAAREIYDEGLQIPPMKLFRAGKPNEDLFEIIGQNVRRSDQVLGDIHAMVSAGLTGSERIKEFMTDYGMHDLEALASVVQDRAETVMRSAISAVPDGEYEHQVQADGVDDILTLPIQISVKGDEIEVNFEGAPPQTEIGGSNCTFSYTSAHACYPLKCIFTPEIPGNAGCYRPIRVSAPAGSIMNCDRNRAVNTRVRTGWYVAPNVFGALSDAAPGQVQAFTGLPSSALFYGVDETGETYSDHLFQGGGQGAGKDLDGISGLLYPTSAANTSVEMFETRVPVLVTERALVPDTGGAGRQRGGLSQVVRIRKLKDDGLDCQVGLYPMGVKAQIGGLFGAAPGGQSGAAVFDSAGQKTDMGTGGLSKLSQTDQKAELYMAGGSGFGDPWTRDLEAVQADLDEGFVTPEGARRDYGCSVGDDGVIDQEASRTLRSNGKANGKSADSAKPVNVA